MTHTISVAVISHCLTKKKKKKKKKEMYELKLCSVFFIVIIGSVDHNFCQSLACWLLKLHKIALIVLSTWSALGINFMSQAECPDLWTTSRTRMKREDGQIL